MINHETRPISPWNDPALKLCPGKGRPIIPSRRAPNEGLRVFYRTRDEVIETVRMKDKVQIRYDDVACALGKRSSNASIPGASKDVSVVHLDNFEMTSHNRQIFF
jgi:hypothetical protein